MNEKKGICQYVIEKLVKMFLKPKKNVNLENGDKGVLKKGKGLNVSCERMLPFKMSPPIRQQVMRNKVIITYTI